MTPAAEDPAHSPATTWSVVTGTAIRAAPDALSRPRLRSQRESFPGHPRGMRHLRAAIVMINGVADGHRETVTMVADRR